MTPPDAPVADRRPRRTRAPFSGAFDCGQCGKTHPRGCRGHHKDDPSEPCTNSPIRGAAHCRMHGAATKAAKEKARQTMVEVEQRARIGELMERFRITTDDHDAGLAEAVRFSRTMRAVYEFELAQLEHVTGADHLGDERLRIVADEARKWTREAAAISKLAIDAGLEERTVRVLEENAAEIGGALQRGFYAVRDRIIVLLPEGARPDVAGVIEGIYRDELPAIVRGALEGK